MSEATKQVLKSRKAKRFYLIIGGVIVLIIFLNNILLPWYVNSGGIISVPSVVGKKFADGRRILDSLGLKPQQGDTIVDNEHPAGVIIIQNPSVGANVKRGRRVYLTISAGEALATVPNIKGRTLRDAKFALEREGLKLGAIEYQPSDQFPQGTIVEQQTSSGKQIRREGYISVVVSQGPTSDKVTVPDLNKVTLTEAQRVLQSLGLKVGNITYVPAPELLPNTVVQQFPLSGDLVASGQAVDLFVVQAVDKKKDLFEN
ncbi:MAG TPA: PASTA domain-containing protein [Bacteroidota bacterium]|jgi:serine/threonine-protein kinase|nr:PASTA domain-containing protein [Bacteroidota bacterium]